MKYRRLGRTNLKISVIGIGTFQYGGEWSKSFTEKDVREIFDRGYDLGINLVDTAPGYGAHLAERLVGNAIKGHRKDWVVATKFGRRFDPENKFIRKEVWDVEGVRQLLEESLDCLQTDYIDLYQFHSGSVAAFNNDELWDMLAQRVKAGQIRHLGISLREGALRYQTESALRVGAQAIQVLYNRLNTEPETEVFPACTRDDLGVLARVPLASGLLSGKYLPGTTFDTNDVRSFQFRNNLEEVLQRVAGIAQNEVPKGVPMAQWALAWCLRNDAVSAVIPGFKDTTQLESAVRASMEMVQADHPQAWK